MTSSICADVLRELGFVPVVPEVSRHSGTAESKAGRHVPAVPAVPAQKSMGRTITVPADVVELAREHKPELLAELPDSAASAPYLAAMRANLLAICRSHGLPERLALDLPDADLAGCEQLAPEGLLHYMRCRLEREGMMQGTAPRGWNQASYCARCGPILIWPGAPVHDVIGCPWCHVLRAGGTVPRPAVTCSTCAHQQRRADTSEAGMHGCAKGHGLHYAHATHPCPDWKPVEVAP